MCHLIWRRVIASCPVGRSRGRPAAFICVARLLVMSKLFNQRAEITRIFLQIGNGICFRVMKHFPSWAVNVYIATVWLEYQAAREGFSLVDGHGVLAGIGPVMASVGYGFYAGRRIRPRDVVE